MYITGWGQYPGVDARVIEADNPEDLNKLLQQGFSGIARGQGRSYGDSALAKSVILNRPLDHFLHFDEHSGVLHCQAGVTLAQIIEVFLPRGWFLPVTPGTKYVSLAGAIAADVHGKNHHHVGCFSEFINELKLLKPDGQLVNCSKHNNSELFHATCGGMGLTGIIIDACVQLIPVCSKLIKQQTIVSQNLAQTLELIEQHRDATYSVAWVDCLRKGKTMGRALLYLGEHDNQTDKPKYSPRTKPGLGIPLNAPGFVLNPLSIRLFNELYYFQGSRKTHQALVDIDPFFYPLDGIANWNRLYGKKGFSQYQCVIPKDQSQTALQEIFALITESQQGSFLSVLKLLGPANNNLLSFPMEGYTFALDFKSHPRLPALLKKLDQVVMEHGGRVYLCKDAYLTADDFKTMYPRWQEFKTLRENIGAQRVFHSLQSQRLGL